MTGEANIAHIRRHKVEKHEAEEALLIAPLEKNEPYFVGPEERFDTIGRTALGRILRVAVTERMGLVRVVTAFDAKLADKREYRLYMVAYE